MESAPFIRTIEQFLCLCKLDKGVLFLFFTTLPQSQVLELLSLTYLPGKWTCQSFLIL